MQLCYLEGFFAQIDAGYAGATRRHAFREDATAAADIQHLLSCQAGKAVNILKAQWVDVVQRLEFAIGIPPAVRELAEFVEFLMIGVLGRG